MMVLSHGLLDDPVNTLSGCFLHRSDDTNIRTGKKDFTDR
jgi:hypothetical protein